jgi:hypothetical protein
MYWTVYPIKSESIRTLASGSKLFSSPLVWPPPISTCGISIHIHPCSLNPQDAQPTLYFLKHELYNLNQSSTREEKKEKKAEKAEEETNGMFGTTLIKYNDFTASL